jgi:hypothetical protein
MSGDRHVKMKYLVELAGVSPGLVRRYVSMPSSLVGDRDLFSAQEGFASG